MYIVIVYVKWSYQFSTSHLRGHARPALAPWHCRGAICGVDTSKTCGVACGSARWSCTSQCHVARGKTIEVRKSDVRWLFHVIFMSFSLQDIDTDWHIDQLWSIHDIMSIFWVWWVSWTSPNVRQIWKSSPQCQHVQCKCSACAVHVELLQGTLKTVCSPSLASAGTSQRFPPIPFRLAVEPSPYFFDLLWSSLILDLIFESPLFLIKKIKMDKKIGRTRWENHTKFIKIHRTILEHYWSQCQGADPQSFDLSRTALAEMDHPKCEKAPDDSRPRMPKDAQGCPRTRTRTCVCLKSLKYDI